MTNEPNIFLYISMLSTDRNLSPVSGICALADFVSREKRVPTPMAMNVLLVGILVVRFSIQRL